MILELLLCAYVYWRDRRVVRRAERIVRRAYIAYLYDWEDA